jgi:hypothetical protein
MISAKVYTIFFLLVGLALVSSECPQETQTKQYAVEWKFMVAEVVVHGVVKSVEPNVDDLTKKSYSVVLEVRCIYKGGSRNENLRIILAGYNPNNCLTANLAQNTSYVVYLVRSDTGEYVQQFKPDVASSQFLEEVVVLCGVTVSYPNGYSQDNNKEECQEVFEDCVPSPALANPPYTENEDKQSSTDEKSSTDDKSSTDETTSEEKDDKDKNVPAKPMESPVVDGTSGNNGGFALTYCTGTLSCLLLLFATILKL